MTEYVSEVWTQELADKICHELAEGKTLTSICAPESMPSKSLILKWADRDLNNFRDQYTRARELQAEVMADEIIDIADDVDADPNRSRLMVDARKWRMSKTLPKKYGDKLDLTSDGNELKGYIGFNPNTEFGSEA